MQLLWAFLLAFSCLSDSSFHRAPTAPPNFTGQWQLNRTQSEGLQNALNKAEVLLVVEQTAQQLKVEQRVSFRGRIQSSTVYNYHLDGPPSQAPISRPVPGQALLQARWLEKERALELRSTIRTKLEGEEIILTTREYWELLDRGKTLKIHRTRETPQETQISRLIFDKR